MEKKERIAKFIAASGLCSRRDAEKLILEGKVNVNGSFLDTPAFLVDGTENITVDGKPLNAKTAPRIWLYYKPRGLVVTHKDPQERPTIFQRLPKSLPRVISVGRLDLDSEGILLLTNDGSVARHLESPATGWKRKYKVRIYGHVTQDKLDELKRGIVVDGMRYKSIDAVLERQQGGNAWVLMTLTEGKNREIRNIAQHFGWIVNRLIRLSFGPFSLKELESGDVKEVPASVVKDQLGNLLKK
jgi:23S rRNA pseudouridine2605 synthase